MGDDQNAHVIICLSHLPNLLFKEFTSVLNAKNVNFRIEKRKRRRENDVTLSNLTSHFPWRHNVACGHDNLSPFKIHDFRLSARPY